MGKEETGLKTQKIGIKQEMINRTQQGVNRTALFRSDSDGSGPSSRARAGHLDRKNRPEWGGLCVFGTAHVILCSLALQDLL